MMHNEEWHMTYAHVLCNICVAEWRDVYHIGTARMREDSIWHTR